MTADEELQGRIKRRDTYYMMSDDPGVYRRGAEELRCIKNEADRLGWAPAYLEWMLHKC